MTWSELMAEQADTVFESLYEKSRINMLIQVVENFQRHRAKLESTNPKVAKYAKNLCDIDIFNMWSLTQE